MKLLYTIIIILLFFVNIEIDAIGDNDMSKKNEYSILTPEEAKNFATNEFFKHLWVYPKKVIHLVKESTANLPLLVQRVDQKDSYYYIVPFNKDNQTMAIVIIDAITGQFKETSIHNEPSIYPGVSGNEAKEILINYLKNEDATREILNQKILMIWKPCEQTQSPYDPLWRIHIKSKDWLIDQKGIIYDKLIELKLKGGSQ